MVIFVPFFIGKTFVWQSVHFNPLSPWIFPSKMTLPADPPAYSTVFPGEAAKPLPANATVINRVRKNCNERIPCLLSQHQSFFACALKMPFQIVERLFHVKGVSWHLLQNGATFK
jgi:hypothetical protein